MNVGIGNETAQFISGNFCFEFSVQCLCRVGNCNSLGKQEECLQGQECHILLTIEYSSMFCMH